MDINRTVFAIQQWVDNHKRAALALACILVGLIIGGIVF